MDCREGSLIGSEAEKAEGYRHRRQWIIGLRSMGWNDSIRGVKGGDGPTVSGHPARDPTVARLYLMSVIGARGLKGVSVAR